MLPLLIRYLAQINESYDTYDRLSDPQTGDGVLVYFNFSGHGSSIRRHRPSCTVFKSVK